jgi:predicted nuclease of predicted toxin-antitoxin system
MKLLFDQNISYKIEKKISLLFSKSKHISSLGLINKDDIEIWNFAKKENFTIVTFDSDFFDISIINGCPPKIIYVRKGNLTTNKLLALLEEKHLIIRNFITNPEKQDIACLEID